MPKHFEVGKFIIDFSWCPIVSFNFLKTTTLRLVLCVSYRFGKRYISLLFITKIDLRINNRANAILVFYVRRISL